ncbi:MAG: TonB-dependent hemoglobin/transferrin/lactoferrin family receptor [Neisseria sp.]|nr:TonB-dependent hemoglobin/transferrin/lactoferrin family receptor [Neisseria sp.]
MKFPFQLTLLAQALALGLAGYAHAETVSKPDNQPVLKQELEEVTVRAVVPSNVVAMDKDELKKSAAQNIDDIALYEPGVDVQSDNLRLGHTNMTIRGVGGNRIQMNLDGIPLPDMQQDLGRGGVFTTVSGRDLVETDTIKRVHIFKGGNGTAQGDGALAGSVNMRTYSPSDFVSDEKPFYFGLNSSYRSTYRSHGFSATTAAKAGPVSGLLILSKRKLHESDNYSDVDVNGAARTQANKQNTDQYNILFKANANLENHQIDASAEQFVRDVMTTRNERLAANSVRSQFYNNDKAKRRRFALGYRYVPSAQFNIDTKAYYQTMDSHDWETQFNGRATILRRYAYEQDVAGLRGDVNTNFNTGSLAHQMQIGLEYRKTDTSRIRNDAMGAGTTLGAGITPTADHRYFPPSKRTVFSKYIQDQINFPNGMILGLGLRHEGEKNVFKPDAAYSSTSNQTDIKPMSSNVWLPSAGLTIPFAKHWNASVAYRRGYRSADVNYAGAGYDSRRGYRVIPNPNLKPENSSNIEAGVRYQSDKLQASFTAFQSRYRDFINTNSQIAADGRTVEFYYDNISRLRTHGWELSSKWNITPELKLLASLADMHSNNPDTNRVIANDYPLNGVLGLAYETDKWGVSSRVRWAKKQTKAAQENGFLAPGYGVTDLTAYWKPNRNLELNAGIYNIFNKKYWTIADTAGLTNASQVTIDRAAQPGRNFAINFAVKF